MKNLETAPIQFSIDELDRELVVEIATQLIRWVGLESLEYDVRLSIHGPSLPRYYKHGYEAWVCVNVKDKTWRFVDSGHRSLQYFPLFNVSSREIGVAYHYNESHSGGIRIKHSIQGIESGNDPKLKTRAALAIIAIKGLLHNPDNFVKEDRE